MKVKITKVTDPLSEWSHYRIESGNFLKCFSFKTSNITMGIDDEATARDEAFKLAKAIEESKTLKTEEVVYETPMTFDEAKNHLSNLS